MVSNSDADTTTEAVSPAAYARGEDHHLEKVGLDAGALAALITKVTAKVDSLERSLETHQQRASVYRQALQHGGSFGMQRMQLHELGVSNFGMGVQTPVMYGGLGAGQQAGGTPFQTQKAAQQAPQQQPAAQYQTHRPSPPFRKERVPPAKDAKIFMQKIDGSEVYKGLGSGFEQWALLFIEQIEMAEQNIVQNADPDLRHALMAKCDITRPDPLQHANELAVWAQMMTDEDRAPKHLGKEVVSAVAEIQEETRRCHKLKKGWTPEEEMPRVAPLKAARTSQ
ncbi:hypothetical protein PInf_017937 [Phytophthora infestans]|nr:hypothetical protein PInf_017937 [Phytophthora infestans]